MIKINKDGKYVEEKQSGESRARAIAQNGNEGLHYEGKKLDELDDLKKAKDYLEREIERLTIK